MLIVIILYDQLVFRPLIAWSDKFSMSDIPDEKSSSWVLDLLQKTKLTQNFLLSIDQLFDKLITPNIFKKNKKNITKQEITKPKHSKTKSQAINIIYKSIFIAILLFLLLISIYLLDKFVIDKISLDEILHVILLGLYTGIRVMLLIILCSLIWVPLGLYIGLNKKLTKIIQPIAQFLAAFPANLFFPIFFIFIVNYKLNIQVWCAPLMILGTQWYILFNIIAGASIIPKELKLAAENMQLSGWKKWTKFYLPAIFPFYVTGAITASGGAWNASVVAEYITWKGQHLTASGLGSYITQNTIQGNFPQLTLGVIIMASWITIINIIFWRKLYQYAQSRFNYN